MKKYITILAFAGLVLASCQEEIFEPAPVPEGTVELSSADMVDGVIVAGPEGGDYSVTVKSSGEWRVSGLCEWITPSKERGNNGDKVVFTVEPNTSMETRTANMKIFCANDTKTISFVSAPEFSVEIIGETEQNTGSDASVYRLAVNSNLVNFDVNLGGADWVEFDHAENSISSKVLIFNVKRSQEFKARTANITIGGQGVKTPAELSLTQAQRDTAFVVEGVKHIKGLEALNLSLTLKTNVETLTHDNISWLTVTDGEFSEKDSEGLKTATITLKADECKGSRAFNMPLKSSGTQIGYVYIKQQNPNPIYADIKGTKLKTELENLGWILADPETGKCEIVEAGLTATTLTLGGSSSYSQIPFDEISCLGVFPALTTISLKNLKSDKIDLSDCKGLTTLSISNIDFAYFDLGSLNTSIALWGAGTYNYCGYKNVVIKGSEVESLDASLKSYYIYYGYEVMESLDITGCPKLKNLACTRVGTWGGSNENFKTLYVTAEQNAAIEAGTFAVNKMSCTEITVK